MIRRQLQRRLLETAPKSLGGAQNICVFCRFSNSATAEHQQRNYAKVARKAPRKVPVQLLRPSARQGSVKEVTSATLLEHVDFSVVGDSMKERIKPLLQTMADLHQPKADTKILQLADEYQVQQHEIYTVARCLAFPHQPKLARDVGKKLLFALAINGNKQAVTFLLQRANHQSSGLISSVELSPVVAQLEILAKNKDPHAMILSAQLARSRGNLGRAIKLAQEALQLDFPEAPKPEPKSIFRKKKKSMTEQWLEASETFHKTTAWMALGRFLQEKGDRPGAIEAYEKATQGGEESEAHANLAALEAADGRKWSAKWLEHTSHAARAGGVDEVYNLGEFYGAPLDQISDEEVRKQMEALQADGFKPKFRYFNLATSQRGDILAGAVPPPDVPLYALLDQQRTVGAPPEDDIVEIQVDARLGAALEWLNVAYGVHEEAPFKLTDLIERATLSSASPQTEES
ncbi:hypothetical protein HDK90DRAFT_207048 [Phyllosticta capitalensis]|uniref:Uncharacterized protein n=1 Tax=Phyllosticta capitalensis TaxID=121624 RepID=A0ABR1YSB7_9PEZI